MQKLNLSALQRRAFDLDKKFYNTRHEAAPCRLSDGIRALGVQTVRLREAQLSPFVSSGTNVDPIAPILLENLSSLLLLAPDLQLDLGQAMTTHSDAHQQGLLHANGSYVHRMRAVIDKGYAARQDLHDAFVTLAVSERSALQEPVVAMTWRVQTELQSRGVDIGASLEAYWTNFYELERPERSAYNRTPAGVRGVQYKPI